MRYPAEKSQRGLSIVELMVALLLASLLTMGLVQIFVGNSKTFQLNEASARVQESGRMASSILSRAIRNANYWGCSGAFDGADGVDSMLKDPSDNDSDAFDTAAFLESFMVGLEGEHDVADGNSFGALEGSDTVTFGGQEKNTGLNLTDHTPKTAAALATGEDSEDYFDVGDLMIISDCRSANLLQVTGFQNNGIVANKGGKTDPGNKTKQQNDFQEGGEVFAPIQNKFYVQEQADGRRALVVNARRNTSATGTMGDWAGPDELVSGIRDLRIQFGRDTTGNNKVDTWSVPGPQSEAEEAIAVRFSLLVRSPESEVVEESQSYCFPGWLDCQNDASLLTDASDRHLYRVYTQSTSLRNRLGGK